MINHVLLALKGMYGLTARQREILDFIEKYTKEKGHSPSFRDIMKHFEFRSTAAVYNHLEALKKKEALPLFPDLLALLL